MTSSTDLFVPRYDPEKLHPSFRSLLHPLAAPTRRMLENIYEHFDDPDGNFVEQFQTTGFDSRYFELYLFAYFSRSGLDVVRPRPTPDFVVSRGGVDVAVEATTLNPSTSGVLATSGKKISDLDEEGILDYIHHELPIRFRSAISSKMDKRYWELPQCKGKPFVIALEAFHDHESLFLTDTALSRYVYGLEQSGEWDDRGSLNISVAQVGDHVVSTKAIPSGFFGQTDSEYVSAILFTNSGTQGKTTRMAYQTGYGNDEFTVRRFGFAYNPDPDARDPSFFSYDLDQPPLVESWGQGLVLLHNPNCLYPVPDRFFPDALQLRFKDGLIVNDTDLWHPMSSRTVTLHLGPGKRQVADSPFREARQFVLSAISRDEFQSAFGEPVPETRILYDEAGWFADDSRSFYGLVVLDKVDQDWSYIVFARDEYFTLRPHVFVTSLTSRYKAVQKLRETMIELLNQPQRLFPELNP